MLLLLLCATPLAATEWDDGKDQKEEKVHEETLLMRMDNVKEGVKSLVETERKALLFFLDSLAENGQQEEEAFKAHLYGIHHPL